MKNISSSLVAILPLSFCLACSPDPVEPGPSACVAPFEIGDANGHADPYGAKSASQARAGRLTDAASIVQPAHGRQQIETGDFVLINDKIAVVIEDQDLSDGYGRFGGEILAIDKVGEDGKPMGLSRYNETFMGIGLTVPNPTSVTVLADGSDGGDAIVRVAGPLELIPFLDGPLAGLFPSDFDFEVAHDFILAPGSEALRYRLSVRNTTNEAIDLGVNKASSDEIYGFFQGSQHQMVTPESGFADPEVSTAWIGFVSDEWGFAWRSTEGVLEYSIEQSGFSLFNGPGLLAEACAITTSDRMEIIAAGPSYDDLREAIRRVDEDDAWPAISGTVKDANGAGVADAWVHMLDDDDQYVSRTRSDESGAYTIHAPPAESVQLIAQKRGYQHDGIDVANGTATQDLEFSPTGNVHVTATRLADDVALPVRVQLIPTAPPSSTPSSFGVADEVGGRLYQEFAITGDVTMTVPPGEHRVLVTRGYEYELHDETVVVTSDATVEVTAQLEHSVDSTGVMCADFHIHSFLSADSSDPIDYKVKGAVADGLDIPCSSEHEWVVDFGPVVESLGLSDWAFGMGSSELTTFRYGHFGVIPHKPRPDAYNHGAIDWVGLSPAETFAAVDALEEKPVLVVNHPRGSIGGYFSAVQFDRDSGTAKDTELWSDNFDALEVFNDSSFESNRDEVVADWFSMLNHGARMFAVGSSDSHHLRTSPVGYPRTCFKFGHDDPKKLSGELVRDALLSGNSTISGGLLMTVLGPNGEQPGETIPTGGSDLVFTVTVEGPSWLSGDSLEIIVDGITTDTVTLMPLGSSTSNRYVNEVSVSASSGSWVVFHAKGMGDLAPLHPGKQAFAVSNPIWVN